MQFENNQIGKEYKKMLLFYLKFYVIVIAIQYLNQRKQFIINHTKFDQKKTNLIKLT